MRTNSEPSAADPAGVAPEPTDARRHAAQASTRDQEFLELVGACGRYLLRTAVPLCGDPIRAEELVQATYERTYRSWRAARNGDPRRTPAGCWSNLRIDGWRRAP
ncbi:hypothetical protein AB0B66_15270 [Catellatospora sp. NPDC049111]|uniref:hypothetical protein n=1 Tax=Catellatospora sp. NPDC049111 TaxID=3155271 RepID=UPI0034012C9D